MVFGLWSLARYSVPATWHLTPDTWYPLPGTRYDNPVIIPSLISIPIAAGSLGKPGMRMMLPATATMNSAPALMMRFRL